MAVQIIPAPRQQDFAANLNQTINNLGTLFLQTAAMRESVKARRQAQQFQQQQFQATQQSRQQQQQFQQQQFQATQAHRQRTFEESQIPTTAEGALLRDDINLERFGEIKAAGRAQPTQTEVLTKEAQLTKAQQDVATGIDLENQRKQIRTFADGSTATRLTNREALVREASKKQIQIKEDELVEIKLQPKRAIRVRLDEALFETDQGVSATAALRKRVQTLQRKGGDEIDKKTGRPRLEVAVEELIISSKDTEAKKSKVLRNILIQFESEVLPRLRRPGVSREQKKAAVDKFLRRYKAKVEGYGGRYAEGLIEMIALTLDAGQ